MIDAISSSLAANPRVNEISEQGTRDGATMQMDDFLQLLTAQIANQDPLEPMKDTEFISQMANIASLERMVRLLFRLMVRITAQKTFLEYLYLESLINDSISS